MIPYGGKLWQWENHYYYYISLSTLVLNSRAEEGGHDLRAAKNNFSEHYFQTITTLLIL